MALYISNSTTVPPIAQGWTPAPSGRGSLNIIWSSLVTITLCSWSAVRPNVPVSGDSWWKQVLRKAGLTLVCIIGPEFLLVLAIGQWYAVRSSVEDFKRLEQEKWTATHGFYAEMGGFMIKLEGEDPYPVQTKGLVYLIEHDFISEEMVKEHVILRKGVIEDRDKADTFVRVLALAQASWFVVNCFARFAQGLDITTLELSVLGFFIPTVFTYSLWWHKPCDVTTTTVIPINCTAAELYNHTLKDQSPAQRWYRTPLDNVERDEWHGSLLLSHWLNILARIDPFHKMNNMTVWKRVPNMQFKHVPVRFLTLLEVLPALPFLAVNFLAWNMHFPTTFERVAWRVASIVVCVAFGLGALIELGFSTFSSREAEEERLCNYRLEVDLRRMNDQEEQLGRSPATKKSFRTRFSRTTLRRLVRWLKDAVTWPRNNSPDGDPSLDVPLRMLIPATVIVGFYVVGRMYILIEDVISFRSMPPGVYKDVDWMKLLPHIS